MWESVRLNIGRHWTRSNILHTLFLSSCTREIRADLKKVLISLVQELIFSKHIDILISK